MADLRMKALTIWQPWASLVMIGAKPYEFRRWDYREREPGLVGQRIVIHAGARPIVPEEIDDLVERLSAGETGTGLVYEAGLPLLQRLQDACGAAEAAMPAYRSALALYRRQMRRQRMVGDADPAYPSKPACGVIELAAGLGTAILGKPRRCTDLFKGRVADSDRIDHHMWAWPLTDIQPFREPAPMKGAQGFWIWPTKIPAVGLPADILMAG